jgi:hypothetical protein
MPLKANATALEEIKVFIKENYQPYQQANDLLALRKIRK